MKATNKIQLWHLVFVIKNGEKEVIYANADQFKAQLVCTKMTMKYPAETFIMEHIDKYTLALDFRIKLRKSFNF